MVGFGALKKLKSVLKNGLAIEKKTPDPVELVFIQKVVEKAKTLHLSVPLAIFLEGFRPLSGIAVNVLIGFEPFAEFFFPLNDYRRLISFLENRENLDRIIENL
jgi:hypothetical protein